MKWSLTKNDSPRIDIFHFTNQKVHELPYCIEKNLHVNTWISFQLHHQIWIVNFQLYFIAQSFVNHIHFKWCQYSILVILCGIVDPIDHSTIFLRNVHFNGPITLRFLRDALCVFLCRIWSRYPIFQGILRWFLLTI